MIDVILNAMCAHCEARVEREREKKKASKKLKREVICIRGMLSVSD